jgi:hypothetical protein
MDKSGAAADDVERGDYEQEHDRRGAFLPCVLGLCYPHVSGDPIKGLCD